MRTSFWGLMAAALLFFCACSTEFQEKTINIPQVGETITITAYSDSPVRTKTGVIDNGNGGKSVVWKSGNAISLFFNQGDNGGNRFTTNTNGPIAEFTGTISAVSGDLSGVGGSAFFWGLYPYNANASCDGSTITTTLPASQLAYQGDVADDLLVTVGRSENLAIYFRNTCSLVGFTLMQENIKQIVFSANGGGAVAGGTKISFDDNGKIIHTPTITAVGEITITPAESYTFETGTTYYFATIPGTFSRGYSLTFTKKDGSEATYVRETSCTFEASTFYTMTNKDAGLSFTKKYEEVDLGLSVKWASCNVGATSPYERGDHFAFGEVEPKQSYTWANYKWGTSELTLTKYCNNSSHGEVDNKSKLDEEDDAAVVNWGKPWRMPTSEEVYELTINCDRSFVRENGVNGVRLTSKINGNSIFLPESFSLYDNFMSPVSCYYTSILGASSSVADEPYMLYFSVDGTVGWLNYQELQKRYIGASIRAVCD